MKGKRVHAARGAGSQPHRFFGVILHVRISITRLQAPEPAHRRQPTAKRAGGGLFLSRPVRSEGLLIAILETNAAASYNRLMYRGFQFSVPQLFLAFVFAGAACTLFPVALDSLNTSRSLLGPALFTLAASSAGAAVGTFFCRVGCLALVGAAVAVLFMAAIVLFVGVC